MMRDCRSNEFMVTPVTSQSNYEHLDSIGGGGDQLKKNLFANRKSSEVARIYLRKMPEFKLNQQLGLWPA